jgi:hypothetical protein
MTTDIFQRDSCDLAWLGVSPSNSHTSQPWLPSDYATPDKVDSDNPHDSAASRSVYSCRLLYFQSFPLTHFSDLDSISERLDDSAMAFEEPLAGEPIFRNAQKPVQMTDLWLDEDLFWLEQADDSEPSKSKTSLDAAEITRLLSIAKPAQLDRFAISASPTSPLLHDIQDVPSDYRKHRLSDDSEGDSPAFPARFPGQRKLSHNIIEKRYRTNLNYKIIALRDSIPSLGARAKNETCDRELEVDSQGSLIKPKLNKVCYLLFALQTSFLACLCTLANRWIDVP